MYSADTEAYFHPITGASNFSLSTECVNALLKAFYATKRGSIERQIIRDLLCAHVPLKQLNGLIIAKNIDAIEYDEPQPAIVGDTETVTVCTGCTMRVDVEKRQNGSNSQKTSVTGWKGEYQVPISGKQCIAKCNYTLSRLYWDSLLVNGILPTITRSISRGLDSAVIYLVRFMFSWSNHQICHKEQKIAIWQQRRCHPCSHSKEEEVLDVPGMSESVRTG